MQPAKYDLVILQGATYRKQFTWESGGQPVDFTGCTAKAQVRKKAGSPEILTEFNSEDGTILLEAGGAITLYLADESTEVLEWTKGVYDLKVYFSNGDEWRILEGNATVKPGVTLDG